MIVGITYVYAGCGWRWTVPTRVPPKVAPLMDRAPAIAVDPRAAKCCRKED